jgi:hypothetical protein
MLAACMYYQPESLGGSVGLCFTGEPRTVAFAKVLADVRRLRDQETCERESGECEYPNCCCVRGGAAELEYQLDDPLTRGAARHINTVYVSTT